MGQDLQEDHNVAATVTESAQEMVKAYNHMVSQGFAAARVGWEQSAATTKSMTEAFQAEQTASGKIWEESIGRARERNEKMAELARAFAAAPNAGVSPEAKEMIDAIVAGDQEYLRTCAEYAQGVEKRRAGLTATMLQGQHRPRVLRPGNGRERHGIRSGLHGLGLRREPGLDSHGGLLIAPFPRRTTAHAYPV